MSSLLFATSLLFVGIVAVAILLSIVVGSLNPYLAKQQARARIQGEARANARRARSSKHV